MMSTLSNVTRRHSLPTFLVLAYALSWCAVPWAGPSLLPWGPALAAVIVLAMTEGKRGVKDLFSQMGRWRVSVTWYVVALSIPIIYGIGAAGLNLLFGATMQQARPVERSPAADPAIAVGRWAMGRAGLDRLRLTATAGGAFGAGRQPPLLHTSGWAGICRFFSTGDHLGGRAVHRRHANRGDLAVQLDSRQRAHRDGAPLHAECQWRHLQPRVLRWRCGGLCLAESGALCGHRHWRNRLGWG